jgi:CheY-like chemotaxis protein
MNAVGIEAKPIWLKRILSERFFTSRPSKVQLPSTPEPVFSNGKRVLVVDDDAVVRLVTSNALRSKGYEVVTAADCSEAIGAVAQAKPDIVLLDLHFPPDVACGAPSWDGLRLMSWLRGLQNVKGARFIVITGSDSEECQQKAVRAGVAGYLCKPLNYDRLLDAIKSALELSTANDGSKTGCRPDQYSVSKTE